MSKESELVHMMFDSDEEGEEDQKPQNNRVKPRKEYGIRRGDEDTYYDLYRQFGINELHLHKKYYPK